MLGVKNIFQIVSRNDYSLTYLANDEERVMSVVVTKKFNDSNVRVKELTIEDLSYIKRLIFYFR